MAMTMLYLGSDGKTERSLAKNLQLVNDNTKGGVATEYYYLLKPLQNNSLLHMSTGIFLMDGYPIRYNFRKLVEDKFFSSVQNLNFADSNFAANAINTMISVETDGKITGIIPPSVLDEYSRMVLVNAIYFNGKWTVPFLPINTNNMPFYKSATTTKQVEMMSNNVGFNLIENVIWFHNLIILIECVDFYRSIFSTIYMWKI